MRTLIAFALILSIASAQDGPTPPERQTSGPGSTDSYEHAGVTENVYGSGVFQYHLFEPALPRPVAAPVVFFLHGWDAVEPTAYRPWIEHLVRRGASVIYPAYQVKGSTLPDACLGNAIVALKDGLAKLSSAGHVKPMTQRVAVVGHSFGGVMAANVAAVAVENGLPQPKAVACMHPGSAPWIHEDWSRIPAGTLLLGVGGEEDGIANPEWAREIVTEATSVAAADKDFILVRSDRHGSPGLVSHHGAPAAPQDALDWYGYWKWFDALTDAAWYGGLNRACALGDTAEQRFMGSWSDGVPVVEPVVTE